MKQPRPSRRSSADPRQQEAHEVLEVVAVRAALELLDVVALALKAAALARAARGRDAHALALLHLAGVEGRIDVAESREARRELRQHVSAVSEVDLLHGGELTSAPLLITGCSS
jgi:hypothetical protein